MKFSIRDLLWAITVVAVAGGWLVDHRQAETKYSRVVENNKALERSKKNLSAIILSLHPEWRHAPS